MFPALGRPSARAIAERRRDLRIASFSDVHLGHGQTPTELIVENLRKAFPDNSKTGELDLILLGGDLFDSALAYQDEASIRTIEGWMCSLLFTCAKRNIVLRVLEGTKSHDRGQSSHFTKIIDMMNLKLDYRYVTDISVEKHEGLGISILYVPDFTTPETDSIWLRVQQAMKEAGVDHVGYANIHGAFTYQMPEIASVQMACHRMDRYLEIVDNYIFTGHIHLSSIYDRILCNGSFDRLAHGEEEAKGHWEALIRQNGEDDFVFVENQNARLYKTIDVTGMDIDQALEKIDREVPTRADSACRVLGERSHPIFTNLSRLKQAYPTIQWSTKTQDIKDVQKNLLVDLRSEFKEVMLTSENLPSLLMERVLRRTDNPALQARCRELLHEAVS